MAQRRRRPAPKQNHVGKPRVEETPALLAMHASWYLVDYQLLGRSKCEIARIHGVHRHTVREALDRVQALLPTIRELIPR